MLCLQMSKTLETSPLCFLITFSKALPGFFSSAHLTPSATELGQFRTEKKASQLNPEQIDIKSPPG